MLHAALALLMLTDIAPGNWNAHLAAPHGPLRFGLEVISTKAGLSAEVRNGSERIPVTLARSDDGAFVFGFPHYNATLTARLDESLKRLAGEWRLLSGANNFKTLPFHAELSDRAPTTGFGSPSERAQRTFGRWRVQFAGDPDPAVAIFRAATDPRDQVEGTFLTATGDYRYLAGTFDDRLVLSCFDGAHAFLFTADVQPDGSLKGTFCAGDKFTDTWTAVRDDEARVGDEFARVRWDSSYGLAELQFPGFDGQLVSLGDARYDGHPRILQIAGSWCPNCHDETALLAEFDRQYRDKGLVITALCFEVTGRRAADTESMRSMFARHGATYETLLAGRFGKTSARESLPALDRVFAYPTTVFIARDGSVRAVHSGFSGPATGEAHAALRNDFTRRIEELIAGEPTRDTASEKRVVDEMWRDERERTFTTFTREPSGTLTYTVMEMTRFDRPTRTDPIETGTAVIRGTTVRLGATILQYDPRAHVILDPRDCSHRFTPAARSPFAIVDGGSWPEVERMVDGLAGENPLLRRECAYYLALQLVTDRMKPREFGGGQLDPALAQKLAPLVSDPDPRVRATAAWAAGVLQLQDTRAQLEQNLDHGYAPVRRESARALGIIDPKSAAEQLAQLARDDIDPLVRAAASR
ncbi:MAG: HEAT repeat domain-containing protein [Planctomycetes bacterium]|nr:HEAT repeat domain-containing protein [Planctomycetota bacterium]